MIISHSHQFIFFHVAKTGGISIRKALDSFCEEPEHFKINRPDKMKAGQPNPFYEVWEALLLHATVRDAQKELSSRVFETYFKFAFVRNPWDWQVSMYHFILSEPTHVKYDVVKQLGSFDAYLRWVIETPKPYPKGATKLQSTALTDANGQIAVDFVGRFESLHRDFAQLCDRLGVNAQLPHVNRTTHRDYRAYYDSPTCQLVDDHFRPDIELFQYEFSETGGSHLASVS